VRTTLAVDDDILSAARDLARARGVTVGKVISDLAREALTGAVPIPREVGRLGFPVLPRRGAVVTDELVNQIRDEEDV
jgi:hypothetical protein